MFVWLILTALLSLVPAAAGYLLWSGTLAAFEINPLQHPEVDDYVMVLWCRETAPGTGRLKSLATALGKRGFSGHWTFAGGCGHLVVDRGVDFYRDSTYEPLFAEHGFTLLKTKKLQAPTVQESAFPVLEVLEWTWWPAAFAGTLLALGLFLRRELERRGPLPRSRLRLSTGFGLGVLLGAGLLSIGLRIDSAAEMGQVYLPFLDLAPVGLALVDSSLFAFVLLVGLLMAAAEECFFRGWAFEYLKRHGGITLAYAGSASLWAALATDLTQFAPLALAGLMLAWGYHRWGSLAVPIVARGLVYFGSLLLPTISTPLS